MILQVSHQQLLSGNNLKSRFSTVPMILEAFNLKKDRFGLGVPKLSKKG